MEKINIKTIKDFEHEFEVFKLDEIDNSNFQKAELNFTVALLQDNHEIFAIGKINKLNEFMKSIKSFLETNNLNKITAIGINYSSSAGQHYISENDLINFNPKFQLLFDSKTKRITLK